MNLEVDGTKKILLVEEAQGLTLNTDGQSQVVAIAGVPEKGPKGEKGDKGDIGLTGIVSASNPLVYNPNDRSLAANIGTGDSQLVIGSDYRLSDTRTPSDDSVTDAKINGTLSQSKITDLVSDLSAIDSALSGKSNVGHTHIKSEVGLSDVDNTSDLDKPVSTAQQTELNAKVTSNSNVGGFDITGTYASPTIASGAVTRDKIATSTIVNDNISPSAAISISKIDGLTSSLSNKQETGQKNQPNGYVGLDSGGKVDPTYLPVQSPIQFASVDNDIDFATAAVSPYGSINWIIGDKIIKTGGTDPGTYVKFSTANNNATDWHLESVGGAITQINGKTGISGGGLVTLDAIDIGYDTGDYLNVGSALDTIRSNVSTNTSDISNLDSDKLDALDTRVSYIPTLDQKNALDGTHGTPNISNKYVTDADPRVTADQTSGASIRSLGTGEHQAAAGNHTHNGLTIVDDVTPSVRALGTTSGTAAAGNDSRIPTQDENNALAGIGDTPSSTNKYVTETFADELSTVASLRTLGTSANQAAAGDHSHVFRTSHNFIIQGNIVTSTALPVPPFFAIKAWGDLERNSKMQLSKLYYKLGISTGTVTFSIKIKRASDSSIVTVGPYNASTTSTSKTTTDFGTVDIYEGDEVSLDISGISAGSAPQNLTVTVALEHTLN
jgi:hypothetical protein